MRTLVCIFLFLSFGAASTAQHIIIRSQVQADTLTFWVKNDFPCDLTLSTTIESPDTSLKTFIPKNQERELWHWPQASDSLLTSIKESLQISFMLGNPNSIHDNDYEYNLPFPRGDFYMLSQGNKTAFSHNSITSQYAFDFAMPEGSYVAAARGGVVAYVEESHKIGGNDLALKEKSNRILICHDDGTVGVYAHLQHNGAFVEVGDPVFVGEVIGLSGNTGFTTSPHLHFSVLSGNRSIPIRFRNEYTILYEGEVYGYK